MSKSILTLTVNPAIDRIVTVDRLVFEDRAYIESTTEAAGGRGINAARVLTSFGATTVAITTSGPREGGRRFEEALQQDSFGKEIVKVRQKIRTNLTISDRRGLSVKLNEVGPKISLSEQNLIIKAVEKLLPGASWLMLCGSLPPGVEAHFYTKLIKLAAKHEVKTLLDTDGDALLHGLEAGPTLVKPNQSEAERLLNTPLITRSHWVDAVHRIKGLGAKAVALSLGSRGIVAATDEGVLKPCRLPSKRFAQLAQAMPRQPRSSGLWIGATLSSKPCAGAWRLAQPLPCFRGSAWPIWSKRKKCTRVAR